MTLLDALLGEGKLLGLVQESSPATPSKLGAGSDVENEWPMLTDDAYLKRLDAAGRRAYPLDYPAELIPWLRHACPSLYVDLTRRLPNEIQRLWSYHASFEDFDRTLALWIKSVQTACELFKRK